MSRTSISTRINELTSRIQVLMDAVEQPQDEAKQKALKDLVDNHSCGPECKHASTLSSTTSPQIAADSLPDGCLMPSWRKIDLMQVLAKQSSPPLGVYCENSSDWFMRSLAKSTMQDAAKFAALPCPSNLRVTIPNIWRLEVMHLSRSDYREYVKNGKMPRVKLRGDDKDLALTQANDTQAHMRVTLWDKTTNSPYLNPEKIQMYGGFQVIADLPFTTTCLLRVLFRVLPHMFMDWGFSHEKQDTEPPPDKLQHVQPYEIITHDRTIARLLKAVFNAKANKADPDCISKVKASDMPTINTPIRFRAFATEKDALQADMGNRADGTPIAAQMLCICSSCGTIGGERRGLLPAMTRCSGCKTAW